MQAVSITPLETDSIELTEVPEPPDADGPLLVQTLAVGVCGTDLELIAGEYGWAPPGRDRLVIGHEALGVVLEAPAGSDVEVGDVVVPIVRRPCDHCANCAAHEWDMCRSGDYVEWGIKAHDGYARERFRITPDFVVKVDARLGPLGVLLEPTTVVAKAWEHIERIGARARWQPATVLVTGAGPIGLLAALLGVQRGLDVHVLDRATEGLKPELVASLGATYHHTSVAETRVRPDVVIECTGASQVVLAVMDVTGSNGIVCLTGVSSAHELPVDVGLLNRRMVLSNDVVFGSVNANRRHYELGATALAEADPAWLGRLITRRVPLSAWHEAYERRRTDVKVVLELA